MAGPYFCGFKPGEAEQRLTWINTTPDPSRPAIHRLNDVFAVKSAAGLYDRDGRRIDEAAVRTISADAPQSLREKRYKGDAQVVPVPNSVDVVEEPVLFGGHLMKHYGHFIIESMSRLWARDLFPDLPIVFTRPGKWRDPPGYGLDVIEALGIGDRLRIVDRPTLFRDVVCPGTAIEYRWKAFTVADEPHSAVAKALELGSGRAWRRPVYLTRSGLPDELRKSDAEPELEAELGRRGFDVIRPEELSLAEQISMFDQSPLIVGMVGSAMHTALFSRSTGRLAVLNWGRGFEHCLLVDGVKRHTSYYLKSMERTQQAGKFDIDVGKTLRLLEEADLIHTPARAAFTGGAAIRVDQQPAAK